MLEAMLAGAALFGVAGPRFVPLKGVAPFHAACVWLAALALRATVVAVGALMALVVLPETSLFDFVGGLTRDTLAHAVVLFPFTVVVGSVLAFAVSHVVAGRRVRDDLRRRALGSGPSGSLVFLDDRIVAAVSPIGRGRVLMSHAALAAFDEDELDAALAHETAHLSSRHRAVRTLGALLACLGRPIPGAAAAERRLRFQLERDADEQAVRATGDPLALASAICKAARSPHPSALIGLAGDEVAVRLEYLIAGSRQASPRADAAAAGVASALAAVSLALLGSAGAVVGAQPGALVLAIACGG